MGFSKQENGIFLLERSKMEEEKETMGSEMSDLFQVMVREHGDQVLIHTKVCVEWKAEHENCKGCISELGCAKAVGMLGVSITPMMYTPKDYEDFERMQQSIQNKLDAMLASKTIEELHKIRW